VVGKIQRMTSNDLCPCTDACPLNEVEIQVSARLPPLLWRLR